MSGVAKPVRKELVAQFKNMNDEEWKVYMEAATKEMADIIADELAEEEGSLWQEKK